MISKEMIEKYDKKKIKIQNKVYIIKLTEYESSFLVELIPINGGYTATNWMEYESNPYLNTQKTFRRAIEKAHEIAEDIESLIEVDLVE